MKEDKSTNTIIEVNNLEKKYGDVNAVNGVSFGVEQGEVFGILGPNGAGKTTTIEMIEGLRKPDGGSIKVCNIDALKEPQHIKELIGVQLQATSLYDNIRVKEALDLFGSYYQKSIPSAEIMEEVSLTGKKNSQVSKLSGGQKQRLSVGLALVNDPEVIFLDEPTTGLDPQARHNIWSIVEKLRERGKTVVMTTHYMEEAEQLCHHLAIIDQGKIIAMDTADNLINKADLATSIDFTTSKELDGLANKIPGICKVNHGSACKYSISTKAVSMILKDLTNLCYDNHIELKNISVRQATLEDVFLAMTGRKLRE
ncbi:MAG: ABC transporter ATP-binding protein [Dehalococcoidales bacterium]